MLVLKSATDLLTSVIGNLPFIIVLVAVVLVIVVSWKKPDTILTLENNGSCPCSKYCAKNWSNEVTDQRPSWKGAKCVNAWTSYNDGSPSGPYNPDIKVIAYSCDDTPITVGTNLVCECAEDSGPFVTQVGGCTA